MKAAISSPGGGAPGILTWTFPGTLSTDQTDNLARWTEKAGRSIQKFDVEVVTAPVGAALIVIWKVNSVDTVTVTVAAGATYAEVVQAVNLVDGDEIYPYVSQVGSTTPGVTATMRARS